MTGPCRGCAGYRCNCPDPVYAGVHPVLHQVDPSMEQQGSRGRDAQIARCFTQAGAVDRMNHAGSNATISERNHA